MAEVRGQRSSTPLLSKLLPVGIVQGSRCARQPPRPIIAFHKQNVPLKFDDHPGLDKGPIAVVGE